MLFRLQQNIEFVGTLKLRQVSIYRSEVGSLSLLYLSSLSSLLSSSPPPLYLHLSPQHSFLASNFFKQQISPTFTFLLAILTSSVRPGAFSSTFFDILSFPHIQMEVVSSKVVNSYYCFWFENGLFNIKEVDFEKVLQAMKPLLCWFIQFNELIRGPENRFFHKNGKDESGTT